MVLFVADSATTEAPRSLTYSSVVIQDDIELSCLIDALNDLDILSCDVGSAYLHPCHENELRQDPKT